METEPATDATENGRPSSARYILLSLAALALVIASVVLLLNVFVVDHLPDLTQERLEAAQQLWEKKGPASYDLNLQLGGAEPGPIHTEVRNGQPTAQTRNGTATPERTWEVWTVPGIFEFLAREMELAEDPQHEMDVSKGVKLSLRCDFDPELGFPVRYHRYSTDGAPEVSFRVTEFLPR